MSADADMRALVHRFFDALETGDLETVADCYAPDMTMWVNLTGQTSTREENLQVLADGEAVSRRRTYNDRNINTFDDGFVVQYTMTITHHDGSRRALWACAVATVHDGLIVRLDEYMDSTRFAGKRPAR